MVTPTYRDRVNPALIDTGIQSNGRAAAAQELAGLFKQFERTGLEAVAANSQDVGRRQGAEAGRTDHPGFRTGMAGLTAYGRAYNDAATRSYAIQSQMAADEAATRLEAEAGDDPEHFRMAFGARADEVVKNAPPEARQILAQAYDQRMAEGVSRLVQKQTATMRQNDRDILSEGIARSADRLAQLQASDDPALMERGTEEQVKLDLLISGALNSGTISATEAGALRLDATRQTTKKLASYRFQKELDSPYGNPVGFIQNLIDFNKTSESLPPDEEEKLVSGLLEDLRQHNALLAMGQKDSDLEQKQRWELGDNLATNSMLDGKLTVSKLSDMLDNDELDPSVARTLYNELQSGNDRPDDSRERFRVETALLETSEDDIAKDSRLSWSTRRELILKRREQMNGWRGTQQAREGAERIDRALNILPGTPVAAQSEEFLRKRERALTEWYNEIDGMPPEKRQAAIISVADRIIETQIRRQATDDAARLRQRVTDLQAKLASGDMSEREQKDATATIQMYERRLVELERKTK
jgi:hypothetical protein